MLLSLTKHLPCSVLEKEFLVLYSYLDFCITLRKIWTWLITRVKKACCICNALVWNILDGLIELFMLL